MHIFKAFTGGFPTHPGQGNSSYGAVHGYSRGAGPLASFPMFDGGEQFATVSALNLGLNAGHAGTFTTAGVIGNIQNLLSSAAGQFSPGSGVVGTPQGWVLDTPATADGWYTLRGVVPSINVAGGVDHDYMVAGLCRVALPSTKTTREAFWFGWTGSGLSRVAHTSALIASGTVGCGIMTTPTGFSAYCQGTTAFGGGATVLGTFANFGIVDDKFFTLGFRAKYSQTASKCYGEWWINGNKIAVPAANLASMVTTNDARGMVSLSSKDGVAARAIILGAKVMVNYDYLQQNGV